MENFIRKFDIYDQFGYFLVGLYQLAALWVLSLLTLDKSSAVFDDFINISISPVVLLISYFVGHVIQAIANFIESRLNVAQKNSNGNEKYAFIENDAKVFFDLPDTLTARDIWPFYYLYALSNDFSGHVNRFNSLHSLYRGFWVVSLINILCVVTYILRTINLTIDGMVCCELKVLLFLGINIALAFLFRNRQKRFWDYMSDKTLVTFYLSSKNFISKNN